MRSIVQIVRNYLNDINAPKNSKVQGNESHLKIVNGWPEPKYSNRDFGNKGNSAVAGIGSHTPFLLYKNERENIENIGVDSVGSCIGVTAWDPVTKTSYAHHIFNGGSEDNKDRAAEMMLKSLDEDLKCFPANVPMDRYKFTLITNNCFELGMSRLVNRLIEGGVDPTKICINRHATQILLNRQTGELCQQFDTARTMFGTEEEKEWKASWQQVQTFLYKAPEEKFAILAAQNLVQLQGSTLNINWGNNALKNNTQYVFQELIGYAQTKGAKCLNIMLSPPIGNLTYQGHVQDIICCLEKAPGIKELTIQSDSKQSFLSQYSTGVAKELAQSGKHLSSISVTANSAGAKAFSDALVALSETGELKEYALMPTASELWKPEAKDYIETNLTKVQDNLSRAKSVTSETLVNTNIENAAGLTHNTTHVMASSGKGTGQNRSDSMDIGSVGSNFGRSRSLSVFDTDKQTPNVKQESNTSGKKSGNVSQKQNNIPSERGSGGAISKF